MFSINNDTTYCGPYNSTSHCYSYIANKKSELLEIDIIRQGQITSGDWISGMCVDTLCYYANVDSIRVPIGVNSESEFRAGFRLMNDETTELAHVIYLIKDANDPSSQIYFEAYAINTGTVTSSNNLQVDNQILIYPNPIIDQLNIKSDLKIYSIELFDLNGKVLKSWKDLSYINLVNFQKGVYLVKINTAESGSIFKRIVKF